jgi:FtsP/CotA-like multicopper oxidase with cupredoxin domain
MVCNHLKKEHACPASKPYCSCIYTLEFEIGDLVEFVIVDEGFTFQSNHPMHVHGSSFAVLAIDKVNLSTHI